MTLTQSASPLTPTVDRDEREHLWRTAVHDRLASMDMRLTGRSAGRPSGGSSTRSAGNARQLSSFAHRDLGDLLITDWQTAGVEGVRRSAMARRDAEALLLFIVFSGQQIVETADETVVLRPGGVLLMSTRTTGKFVVPDSLTKRTVRIPLTALSPLDMSAGIPDCLYLNTAENPLVGLAHDFLAGVSSRIDTMSPAEVEASRNALLVLVAGMIRATQSRDVGETDFLPTLRRHLETWIVEHLTSGAIRVGDLAAAHNVAPRTVHRAFAATGDTVGSVVRAQRIAAARSDLVNTTSSIAAVAHRWGFCDASHLGREFRREFSMSPGDYREAYSIA
ncbi:AraC-like DNA-binding protein [Marmoricola sp. URHA0025 HA25]